MAAAPRSKSKSKARPGRWRQRRGIGLIVLVLAGMLVVRATVIEQLPVLSRAMENTLLFGDRILVEKITFGARLAEGWPRLPGLRLPEPGDVIAFAPLRDPSRAYVKRCVAVGGQTVEVLDKAVYVDGQRLADPPLSKYMDPRILPLATAARDNLRPLRVPVGSVFVMGDSRDNSRDSRHWGCLPLDRVIGRVFGIWWSTAPPQTSTHTSGGKTRWSRIGRRVQ